jgi:translation initiation factor 1
MKSKKLNSLSALVFSTNPDFQLKEEEEIEETLPISSQKLLVKLDTKQRAGKVITAVTGFVGKVEDLEALGKLLKNKCGTGGSVKDGWILIQGDFKQKILQTLQQLGYTAKG